MCRLSDNAGRWEQIMSRILIIRIYEICNHVQTAIRYVEKKQNKAEEAPIKLITNWAEVVNFTSSQDNITFLSKYEFCYD